MSTRPLRGGAVVGEKKRESVVYVHPDDADELADALADKLIAQINAARAARGLPALDPGPAPPVHAQRKPSRRSKK